MGRSAMVGVGARAPRVSGRSLYQTKTGSFAENPESAVAFDTILMGDAIEIMQQIPDKSVDLIFADPPYNLQLRGQLRRPNDTPVAGVDAEWDRFENFEAYDRFSKLWLQQARRLLKDNGALWVIGSYHNIFRVGKILQDLGFWIQNDVIWCKSNPMPNFRGTRFTNAHETLIWCAKSADARDLTFNYEALKELNDGLQMRSDWYLPICNGAERLRQESGEKAHPTQKPESLLHRVLVATSCEGDLILDPFAGTGTTLAVAKYLRRRFIGIEREQEYVELAKKRLAKVSPCDPDSIKLANRKRREPRVAFGQLIEQRMICPGDILISADGGKRARVHADGRISCADQQGSIHQIAALAKGSASCNGWTYWHIRENGKKKPIDSLRQKYRSYIAPH